MNRTRNIPPVRWCSRVGRLDAGGRSGPYPGSAHCKGGRSAVNLSRAETPSHVWIAVTVSPDARLAVFDCAGPDSGETDLQVIDLQGKRARMDLTSRNYATFVPEAPAYCGYNPASVLYVFNLKNGYSQPAYPPRSEAEKVGE